MKKQVSKTETCFYLKRACRQADEQVHIVRLNLRLVRRLVTHRLTASVASVCDDKAATVVRLASDGAQNSAAGIGAVARQNVDVQRAKAKGAVIARSVSEGKHLFAAAHADKSAIVFLKSLRFHKKFLS